MSSPRPKRSPTSFMAGSSTSFSTSMASSLARAPRWSSAASTSASAPSGTRCRMRSKMISSGAIPSKRAVGSGASCSSTPSYLAMKRGRASSRRAKMRSSASSTSSSGISPSGRMCVGLIMARSRPASTARARNTLFRVARAGRPSPNDTLLTPRLVNTPGRFSLIRRMPSMVALPDSRYSSSPVARVKVRASKMRAPGSSPYSPTTMSWIFVATPSLASGVLAMPISSSMVSATTAAPCFLTMGTTWSIFTRPFSMLMELTMARPG